MQEKTGPAAVGTPENAPESVPVAHRPDELPTAAAGDDAGARDRPDGDGRAAGDARASWADAADIEGFSRRIAAARQRIGDFDAVALDPGLPVSAAMAAAIARSESGPDIAYHLGRNPELAARIAALDPLSAARELGRIEAQLAAVPRRTVTAAPPPLRPLGGGETAGRDPDAMSYQEYRAWRRGG